MPNYWPAPHTFQADELVMADTFNSAIRDAFTHIKSPPYGASALAASITITATTFTNVNTALAVGLTTYGGMIEINVAGAGGHIGAGRMALDIAIDGTRVGPSVSGLNTRDGSGNLSFNVRATGIASGAHVIALQAKVESTTTGSVSSGTILEVMEVP